MMLTVMRAARSGDALPGTLLADGQFVAYSLENAERAIKAGRYRVLLTESGRVRAGSLWSPRDDHKLPLLCDVVGRSGIRIHAGNKASDVEGCIAVGLVQDEDVLVQSRAALIKVMALIDAAQKLGEDVIIDVLDAV